MHRDSRLANRINYTSRPDVLIKNGLDFVDRSRLYARTLSGAAAARARISTGGTDEIEETVVIEFGFATLRTALSAFGRGEIRRGTRSPLWGGTRRFLVARRCQFGSHVKKETG